MRLELGEASVERLEAVDTGADGITTCAHDLRQRLRGLETVPALAPRGEARCLGEWHIEAAEVEQEPNPLTVRVTVVAVPVLSAWRPRQQTVALVEAERVGAHPQVAGKLADAHQRSVAPIGAQVKSRRSAAEGR